MGLPARLTLNWFPMHRLMRWIRRHNQYVVVLTALSAATVVLLVVAYYNNGYWRDLNVNVAASIIIVIASYLIFNPLVEGFRVASTRERPRLDLDDFIDRISRATNEVNILDTWTRLLDDHLRDRCFGAFRDALTNGVNVRILLLNPKSKAAEQRTEEIGHPTDVPREIRQTLFHLYAFQHELSSDLAQCFEVRVYSASPSVHLYRSDERAFLSFFPIGRGAHETPKLETHMSTPWGQTVKRRFDELWNDPRTISLDQSMQHAGMQLLFEDEYSRIWLLNLEPGAESDWYRHDHPYLSIVTKAGVVQTEYQNGVKELRNSNQIGAVPLRFPDSGYRLKNKGSRRHRNLVIELKETTT